MRQTIRELIANRGKRPKKKLTLSRTGQKIDSDGRFLSKTKAAVRLYPAQKPIGDFHTTQYIAIETQLTFERICHILYWECDRQCPNWVAPHDKDELMLMLSQHLMENGVTGTYPGVEDRLNSTTRHDIKQRVAKLVPSLVDYVRGWEKPDDYDPNVRQYKIRTSLRIKRANALKQRVNGKIVGAEPMLDVEFEPLFNLRKNGKMPSGSRIAKNRKLNVSRDDQVSDEDIVVGRDD